VKLLTEAEARNVAAAEVFTARYGWVGAAVITAVFTLVGVVTALYHEWATLFPWSYDRGFPSWLVGGFILLIGMIAYGHIRATLSPSAWLVRATRSDLFIKFRSFHHWRWPVTDKVVLKLDHHEVDHFSYSREFSIEADFEGKTKKYYDYLYIFLRETLPEDVFVAIADENTRMYGRFVKSRTHHSPLVVGTDRKVLRIAWDEGNARARPTTKDFFTQLGPRVLVRELPQGFNFSAATRPFREADSAAITALVARGQKIDAIRVLRQLRGYGLKEAKERIERGEYE
jgi:hypothetical protein